MQVVKHHGGTDPLVLCKVLNEYHGISKELVMSKLGVMEKIMVEHYVEHKDRHISTSGLV